MNEELFLKLRGIAQKRGVAVRKVLDYASRQEQAEWFGATFQGGAERAYKLYKDYKDKHFYDLWVSGRLVSSGPGEAARRAECQRRLDREFEKQCSMDFTYGTSTGRMSSTMPNFANIPKAGLARPAAALYADIEAAYKLMRKNSTKFEPFDMKLLEEVGRPDPMIEAYRKATLDAIVLDPNPRFVMTKARKGVHDSVFIDFETYTSDFFGITKEPVPMNTEQLRAALVESEAADAVTAAKKARDEHLAGLQTLAAETTQLLANIRYPSNSARNYTRVKDLKALAAELGAKFVPSNTPGYFVVVVL